MNIAKIVPVLVSLIALSLLVGCGKEEATGMKPGKNCGIDIYFAAEERQGIPGENWLPINRKGENIDVIMRFYNPGLEK